MVSALIVSTRLTCQQTSNIKNQDWLHLLAQHRMIMFYVLVTLLLTVTSGLQTFSTFQSVSTKGCREVNAWNIGGMSFISYANARITPSECNPTSTVYRFDNGTNTLMRFLFLCVFFLFFISFFRFPMILILTVLVAQQGMLLFFEF